MTLKKLYSIIRKRIVISPKNSYVATLYRQGEDAILQKIGEEAIEVILAGKGENKKRIIEEMADLYFMTLIFIVSKKISLDIIYEELNRRNNNEKLIGKS